MFILLCRAVRLCEGTRPVIFKIERLDYKVLKVDTESRNQEKIVYALKNLDGVFEVIYREDKKFIEIFMDRNNEVGDQKIIDAVNSAGNFKIFAID